MARFSVAAAAAYLSALAFAYGDSTTVKNAEASLGEIWPGAPPFSMPLLKFRWPNNTLEGHWHLGHAIGSTFEQGINSRLSQSDSLQNKTLPSLKTAGGKELYEAFLSLHETTFPEYVQELKGIADGAKLPFDWVFLAQLDQEFRGQLDSTHEVKDADADHCTDYMMCSETACVGGHNEDNAANDVDRGYVLDAQLGDAGQRIVAWSYMGELPTGAFGVNARGIGFTLNWVGPPPPSKPGLGRGFISRSLLDATSLADAIERITIPGQGGGHNINVFDFCHRSIHNVEVAESEYAVRPIGSESFYHANQYRTLNVPNETIIASSKHRTERLEALARPGNLREILNILGDQEDHAYPIFKDEVSHARGDKSDWTMATVSYDLDSKVATIYSGNPSLGKIHTRWSISEMITEAGGCQSSPPRSVMFML
mmetsp:Transcript_24362/g.51906  ORF Transcript_24362/g.51906 Transcript_24362/m.51906 type:complete len:426 (+) Transcript_24362:133-1410(+)